MTVWLTFFDKLGVLKIRKVLFLRCHRFTLLLLECHSIYYNLFVYTVIVFYLYRFPWYALLRHVMILQVVILLSCNMLTCRKLRFFCTHTYFVLPLSHTKLHKYYFELCVFPTNVMLFNASHEQMATSAQMKKC